VLKCGEGCAPLYEVLRSLLRWHPLYIYVHTYSLEGLTPFKHQVSLVGENAVRPRIRVLVGDEVGLGKTIEAIMMLKLLKARLEEAGVEPRILVIVPKVLVDQWISELRRAGVTGVKVLERGSDVEEAAYRREPGVYVASLQLLRRRNLAGTIAKLEWHVVVVDEAHNVGIGGSSLTLSYRLIHDLTRNPETSVILLTATPHRGKALDYIARLLLLVPLVRVDEARELRRLAKELDNEYFYTSTYRTLLYRRTKDVVNRLEGREVFKPATLRAVLVHAGKRERQLETILLGFLNRKIGEWGRDIWETRNPRGLLLTLILKRSASSSYAAAKTFEKIVGRLAEKSGRGRVEGLERLAALLSSSTLDLESDPEEMLEDALRSLSEVFSQRDLEELRVLAEIAREVAEEGESKLHALIQLVEKSVADGKRVVVFTEYRDTLEYVYGRLKRELGDRVRIACVSGAASGECSKSRVEEVKSGLQRGDIDVVVATDVASEGLNLQAASVLVNYDLPWSPLKLEQRIGRVWRIGQRDIVEVYNLFRNIRSEQVIVEKLYMKILAVSRALGSQTSTLGSDIEVYAEGTFKSVDSLYVGGSAGAPDAVASVAEEVGEVAIARAIIEGEHILDDIARRIIERIKALRDEVKRKKIYPSTFHEEEMLTLKALGLPAEEELDSLLVRQARRLAAALGMEEPHSLFSALRVFRRTLAAMGVSVKSGAGLPRLYRSPAVKGRLYIIPVTLKADGKTVYEEPMGVEVEEGRVKRVIRGPQLLDLLTGIVERGITPASGPPPKPPHLAVIKVKSEAKKLVDRSLPRTRTLNERLQRVGLPSVYQDSITYDIDEARIIVLEEGGGGLQGASMREGVEDPRSLEEKLSTEEKAVRLVMEYEIREGRLPEDARKGNPYDIVSRDPVTGEVLRYIEVKSHSGFNATIELTENEYEFARSHRDKYWIYLVLGVETGRPVIVPVRDPLSRLAFQERLKIVMRVERRYVARLRGP